MSSFFFVLRFNISVSDIEDDDFEDDDEFERFDDIRLSGI